MTAIRIRRAEPGDADAVAALFDAYRQFYGRETDRSGARAFIGERLRMADSLILLAEADGVPAGFTQLYPSFTSVGMARIFVLNDLFVAPEHRATGLGRALLHAAAEYARSLGAVRLTLSTQHGNRRAQSVYEANGWARDDQFLTYNLQLAS